MARLSVTNKYGYPIRVGGSYFVRSGIGKPNGPYKVIKIETSGAYAKNYGPRVKFEHGGQASVDDLGAEFKNNPSALTSFDRKWLKRAEHLLSMPETVKRDMGGLSRMEAREIVAKFGRKTKRNPVDPGNRELNPYTLSPEAKELVLFIQSDRDLYRQQTTPIIDNLAKKLKKGIYKPDLAVKMWRYLADNGAKKYSFEHGNPQPGTRYWMAYKGFGIFTVKQRLEAARYLEEYYLEAVVEKSGVPVIIRK